MMYTPTPAARRPRPPRSLSRQRTPLIAPPESSKDKETAWIDRSSNTTPEASRATGKSAETPLSTYLRERTEDARSGLARISASPADVSFALDPDHASEPSCSSSMSFPLIDPSGIASSSSMSEQSKFRAPVGLGLSDSGKLTTSGSSEIVAETSPPPPYGHMALSPLGQAQAQAESPSIQATSHRSLTPLRQDSGQPPSSASSSSPRFGSHNDGPLESYQVRVTSNAPTPALGDARPERDGSEEELSDGEVRRKLREVKQRLQQREDELIIAAKVADRALRSHEQVVAILPHQMKARMPSHLVDLHSNILDPSSSPRHFRSLSGSGSPYTFHLRQFSSSTNTQGLSPIESYPPTASTYHVDQFQTMSPQFPEYGLDSPFRIISPEHQFHGSQRSFPSTRLTETTLAMPHHRQRSRPSIFGSHSFTSTRGPSPRYARMSALQAEAEDRIIALEQALMEARENEESQRKVASRLRKDIEKMQRELLRADEQRAQEELQALKASVVGGGIGARKRDSSAEDKTTMDGERPRRSPQESQNERERLGWGSTAFPEFPPAGPSRSTSQGRYSKSDADLVRDYSFIEEPLGRITIAALRDEVNDADDSDSSVEVRLAAAEHPVQTVSVDDLDSISSTSQDDRVSSANDSRTNPFSGKSRRGLPILKNQGQDLSTLYPKTQFLSPPKPVETQPDNAKPPTPRVTIESPSLTFGSQGPSRRRKREGSSSQESGSSIRKSPWPSRRAPESEASPDVRRTLDFFSSVSYAHSRSPSMSPASASVGSRMASIRAYMSHNLSAGPVGVGRTLGSELGSEFGEDWERDFRNLVDTPMDATNREPGSPSPPSRSATASLLQQPFATSSDPEGDREDDDTSLFSPMSQPPFPLPANVSAALSSLAMALAPDAMFNHSFDLTQPRNPGINHAAYEMLTEACKAREIRWADGSTEREPTTQSTEQTREGTTSTAPVSGAGSLPSQESMVQWSNNRDPWEAAEYSDDLSVSDDGQKAEDESKAFSFRPGPSVISSGKRPVSYIDHVSGDTPRKYALAHRRANSAAAVASRKSLLLQDTANREGLPGTSTDKGKGTEHQAKVMQELKPDQTLTRRGLRSLQSSLASSDVFPTASATTSSATRSTASAFASASAYSQTSKRDSKTVRFAAQVSSSVIEPSTIPARLVHDVFCWLGIFLEYFEWALILIIRICIDIRSGPGGTA
ncbi:hypothetical protein I316_07227 [Kwoniella heveanensis BCC8398]|uniref:Uncharacterized protein n=1 Tax=Kwoniella heveanensis BCC8398 TaxID=1296120 RepID=A0A1B9GJF6_9TREE|nr:hypothetical protein I316_07227 [Kwoniella heveanensis BCC8398]